MTRIGDAQAPGAIAHAGHGGHSFARELEIEPAARLFRRDSPLAPLADPELHSVGVMRR